MENKHDYSKMALNTRDLLLILFYYAVLIIVSIFVLSRFLPAVLNFENVQPGDAALIITMSASLGSAVYYTRKLYKASIGELYNFKAQDHEIHQRIGTIAFFLTRPLFGIAFAIVLYCAWKASIYISVKSGAEIKELVALIIPSSFFCGFSAGKIIEKFLEKDVPFFDRNGAKNNE